MVFFFHRWQAGGSNARERGAGRVDRCVLYSSIERRPIRLMENLNKWFSCLRVCSSKTAVCVRAPMSVLVLFV